MCLCSKLQGRQGLSDNEFLRFADEILALLYRHLSNNAHLTSQLQFGLKKKVSSSGQPQSQSERRLRALFDYDPADLDLPIRTLLDLYFDRWSEQPSSFWGHLQRKQIYLSDDPQYLVIVACLEEEQSSARATILRRLYCTVLHLLRANQERNDDSQTIARSIYDFLHPDQSQPEEDQLVQLVNSVETLIRAGARYANITNKLGIGSLFILGETVGRSVWEKWLPHEGPVFERAMKHLKEKGIVKLGKRYEGLAGKLIGYLQDRLPTPRCVWITEDVTIQRPKKRSRQPRKPNPKRRRSNANNGVPATSAEISRAGGFGGRRVGSRPDALAGDLNSLQVLLTAAEHSESLGGSVPCHPNPPPGNPSAGGGMTNYTSTPEDSTLLQSTVMDLLPPYPGMNNGPPSAEFDPTFYNPGWETVSMENLELGFYQGEYEGVRFECNI